jgi:hypothetical protein
VEKKTPNNLETDIRRRGFRTTVNDDVLYHFTILTRLFGASLLRASNNRPANQERSLIELATTCIVATPPSAVEPLVRAPEAVQSWP